MPFMGYVLQKTAVKITIEPFTLAHNRNFLIEKKLGGLKVEFLFSVAIFYAIILNAGLEMLIKAKLVFSDL